MDGHTNRSTDTHRDRVNTQRDRETGKHLWLYHEHIKYLIGLCTLRLCILFSLHESDNQRVRAVSVQFKSRSKTPQFLALLEEAHLESIPMRTMKEGLQGEISSREINAKVGGLTLKTSNELSRTCDCFSVRSITSILDIS